MLSFTTHRLIHVLYSCSLLRSPPHSRFHDYLLSSPHSCPTLLSCLYFPLYLRHRILVFLLRMILDLQSSVFYILLFLFATLFLSPVFTSFLSCSLLSFYTFLCLFPTSFLSSFTTSFLSFTLSYFLYFPLSLRHPILVFLFTSSFSNTTASLPPLLWPLPSPALRSPPHPHPSLSHKPPRPWAISFRCVGRDHASDSGNQ